jgi:hypothetical protein
VKCAVIAPTPYLRMLRASGYHMALGQYLMDDPEYLAHYQLVHRRGGFIMVDNGAAEGDIRPFIDVVRVSNEVGADEIAMPDVLRDGRATWELTSAKHNLGLVPPPKRMVIPQGKTWAEWRTCAERMIGGLEFATIGIAKHLEALEWGRGMALLILNELGVLTRYNIHLLGVCNNPQAEIERALGVYRGIRGIDTGAPVAYAQNGAAITSSTRYSLDWTNWEAPPELVRRNIRVMERWCYAKFEYDPWAGEETPASGV